jgi:hypothetical protein
MPQDQPHAQSAVFLFKSLSKCELDVKKYGSNSNSSGLFDFIRKLYFKDRTNLAALFTNAGKTNRGGDL